MGSDMGASGKSKRRRVRRKPKHAGSDMGAGGRRRRAARRTAGKRKTKR